MNGTNPFGRQGIAAAPVSLAIAVRQGATYSNRPARPNRCSDADPRRGGLKVRRWRARCGDGRLLGTGVTDAAIADATWRVVHRRFRNSILGSPERRPFGSLHIDLETTDRSLGGHCEGGTVGWMWWLASSWRVQAWRMIAAAPRVTASLSVLCSLTDITVLTSPLSRRTSALRHKRPFHSRSFCE